MSVGHISWFGRLDYYSFSFFSYFCPLGGQAATVCYTLGAGCTHLKWWWLAVDLWIPSCSIIQFFRPTLNKNDKFWLLQEKFAQKNLNFQFCRLDLVQISVKPSKIVLKIFSFWLYFRRKTSSLDPHFSALLVFFYSGYAYPIKNGVPPPHGAWSQIPVPDWM